MAAIERGEGSEDRVVRGWLAKAVTASRGPQWTCENCGHVHATWQPVCEHCDSFDTLAWAEAPQSESAFAGTAQMLPLIVGALEDRRDDPEIEDPEPEVVDAAPVEETPAEVTEDMAEENDPHAPGHVLPDMGEVSNDAETSEPARTAAN
jgi:HemY protein